MNETKEKRIRCRIRDLIKDKADEEFWYALIENEVQEAKKESQNTIKAKNDMLRQFATANQELREKLKHLEKK